MWFIFRVTQRRHDHDHDRIHHTHKPRKQRNCFWQPSVASQDLLINKCESLNLELIKSHSFSLCIYFKCNLLFPPVGNIFL